MFREDKKCVIYVRVSTENQVDGYSLDAQRNNLKRYVEREVMQLINIYEDAGKSGKSIEGRPAFKQMLKDIENGLAIDYILVYKLSRFGRNAADILNSLETIQMHDVNLISAEEGIDSSQTSGRLLISVLSAVSEIERENILEQTMNGRREKARQGGWNGGQAPYGYKIENGKLVIIEEEASVVKGIFEAYTIKNCSMMAIVIDLNLKSFTRVKDGNIQNESWLHSSIANILDNPVYTGKIIYGRSKTEKVKGTRNEYKRVAQEDYIIVDNCHEAIISDELWESTLQKRKEIKIRYKHKFGRERGIIYLEY